MDSCGALNATKSQFDGKLRGVETICSRHASKIPTSTKSPNSENNNGNCKTGECLTTKTKKVEKVTPSYGNYLPLPSLFLTFFGIYFLLLMLNFSLKQTQRYIVPIKS